MKLTGTEKQVAYAESLLNQFVAPLQQDNEAQTRLIENYRAKMAADPSKDFSAKIAMREARIASNQRKIDYVNSIESAGELIDAIKFGRFSLMMN